MNSLDKWGLEFVKYFAKHEIDDPKVFFKDRELLIRCSKFNYDIQTTLFGIAAGVIASFAFAAGAQYLFILLSFILTCVLWNSIQYLNSIRISLPNQELEIRNLWINKEKSISLAEIDYVVVKHVQMKPRYRCFKVFISLKTGRKLKLVDFQEKPHADFFTRSLNKFLKM